MFVDWCPVLLGWGVLCQGSWEAQQSVDCIGCCCRVFRRQPPPANAGQRQNHQVRARFTLVFLLMKAQSFSWFCSFMTNAFFKIQITGDFYYYSAVRILYFMARLHRVSSFKHVSLCVQRYEAARQQPGEDGGWTVTCWPGPTKELCGCEVGEDTRRSRAAQHGRQIYSPQ